MFTDFQAYGTVRCTFPILKQGICWVITGRCEQGRQKYWGKITFP